MTVALCIIAMTGLPCDQARGGHALYDPSYERGGHAVLVLDPIPHMHDWICIHQREGAWNDTGDPYWGGLQMDRSFMGTYGADMERKYGGFANLWSPRDQMVVAERAWPTRGFKPWPLTARACGVL